MPNVPVTLTPWFDAKDNPPKDGEPKLTDRGEAQYEPDMEPEFGEPGWYFDSHPYLDAEYLDPQPSVWCNPSPPDMNDPLTAARLLALLDALPQRALYDIERVFGGEDVHRDTEVGRTAARLRRALDQIGTTEKA